MCAPAPITKSSATPCHADKSLCEVCKGDGRCAAKAIAASTLSLLNTIIDGLEAAIVALGVVAVAMSKFNIPGALVVADVAVALSAALAEDYLMAALFNWESSQDLAYFGNGDNIAVFGEEVSWSVGLLAIFLGVAAGALGWAEKSNPILLVFGVATAFSAIGNGFVDIWWIQQSIDNQEAAIGYPPSL
jgi:hypothetical protein